MLPAASAAVDVQLPLTRDFRIVPNITCRRQLPIAATSASAEVVVVLKSDAAAAVACGGELLHPTRTALHGIRQMIQCGRNAAWLFDTCTCVAGYEDAEAAEAAEAVCLPCLNGTFRSLSHSRCTPCDNGTNAPYLGMVSNAYCFCLVKEPG